MAKFDAKRFSRMDWAVVGAAGVSFICLFLPWYGASYGFYSASVSGWSTSYGWLGGLLIIAAGVGAAVLGTLIVILRWITLPSGHAGITGFSYGPRVGIYLTIIAGVVQVVAAVGLFRSSGEKLPWAK